MLYIGTDHGLYAVRLSSGLTISLSAALPGAAVHDLAIHEASSTLIIGTHGRGIYNMDLALVRHGWTNRETPALGPITSISHNGRGNYWSKWFPADHAPLHVPVHLPQPTEGMTLQICSADSLVLTTITTKKMEAGLQFFPAYDLRLTEAEVELWRKNSKLPERDAIPSSPAKDGHYYLPPGRYFARIESGTSFQPFEIKR